MLEYPTAPGRPDRSAVSLEERLENCEVVHFETCPFPLPEGDERRFLLAQRLGAASKNISYVPQSGRASGFQRRSAADAERLRELFAAFSRDLTAWLSQVLPRYATAWRLDQVSFRPEEEATRTLRLKARNDLLHCDAFPSRPTQGQRILRVFANVNPTEPRIWITSDPFPVLLERYGRKVGLPGHGNLGWTWHWQQTALRLLVPGRPRRSSYDAFMLRFHDFLKMNDDFQEHARKRCWSFQPGSAWMCFTDAVSHAALRGRFALEHSYFVPPTALHRPELSPLALLERACGMRHLNAA